MTPCSCRNPVHQRCLFQWICDQQGRSECEICHEPWRGLLQGGLGRECCVLGGFVSWLALPCPSTDYCPFGSGPFVTVCQSS